MTRLLAPEMFGVMAIATMVTVILSLLSDLGLRQNIVQSRRGDDPAFLNTAWVVQIARGGLLWVVALLLSIGLDFANLNGMMPVKSVYASSELPLVIAVNSFSAVILGFQSTKMATAYRTFDQKRLVEIELVSQLAGLVVMVFIGVYTRSIWTLVAGGLIGSLTTTVLSHTWMNGYPNRFRWEKEALQELISFGKWVFVSSALHVFAVSGDRLMLGVFVDANVLGLYAIAALIVRAIEAGLGKLFAAVSLPALSEIARDNPSRLREIYYKLRIPGDLLLLFLVGLIFAAGQEMIDLLYDSRYSGAGAMLEVLALSLFAVRYGVAHQMYLAMGIPRYLTVISIARFASIFVLVPSLYYLGGVQAAIWGIAVHALVTVPLVYHFNGKLGLNDIRKELMVLPSLPAGLLCGYLINLLFR